MAKITRATQKIFASSIAVGTPPNAIPQFGSLAASAPAWSSDPAVIQALAAWTSGWASAVVTGHAPPLQDQDATLYVITRSLAYLFQQGAGVEWDSDTEYCHYAFASDGLGNLFVSQQNANINHALTDTSWWHPYAPAATADARSQCKAWVRFNGGSGTIESAYNISSVVHLGTGQYLIDFSITMADGNYAWAGNVGGSGTGSHNTLFEISRNQVALTIGSWRLDLGGVLGDSPEIFLMIFGN